MVQCLQIDSSVSESEIASKLNIFFHLVMNPEFIKMSRGPGDRRIAGWARPTLNIVFKIV